MTWSTWAHGGDPSPGPKHFAIYSCSHRVVRHVGLDVRAECRCGQGNRPVIYIRYECGGCSQNLFYELGKRYPAWDCDGDRRHAPVEDFAEAA